MKKFASALIVVAALSAAAQAQFGFDLDGDTNIVISNSGPDAALVGAEFHSDAGALVFGSAAPFGFALKSTVNDVQLAQIPGNVALASGGTLTFDTKYSGDPASGDLTALMSGTGFSQVNAPYTGGGGVVDVTPEPASGILAAFGLLGLLGFRRRR